MKLAIRNLQFAIFLFSVFSVHAQDLQYARSVIDTLTSEQFHGRGYVNNGDGIAAKYIASEYAKAGLKYFGADYFQRFSFPVNTFPDKMEISIGTKKLIAGADYIVNPNSNGTDKTYSVKRLSKYSGEDVFNSNKKTCFTVYTDSLNAEEKSNLFSDLTDGKIKCGALVIIEPKKLTWSVARARYKIPVLTVLEKSFDANAKEISIHISEKFNASHQTQNVVGYFPAVTKTDSFIVFTAHYDHLGRMGKQAYFPGANDNASGVSMQLNLAKYYTDSTLRPKYNLLFIAFAGEEAGLIGSKYFTEHPLVALNKMRFLINMDLMGTGDDGMMVVNATEFKTEFELLKKINSEKNYLVKTGERGKAKNSDHYYFSENGVPSFFFYTLGGVTFYHDINDKAATLPLTDYADVFNLIVDFVKAL